MNKTAWTNCDCRAVFTLVILLLAQFVIAGGLACEASGQTAPDVKLLDGLRSRRLFELAEFECRSALKNDALSDRQRAQWTVQLARTYAEQAVQSPPDQRQASWDAAHASCRQFLRRTKTPSDSRLIVTLQDALTWLAQGELSRQEAESLGDATKQKEAARGHLFRAVRALSDLQPQVAKALREAYKREGNRDEPAEAFSSKQLLALQQNLTYQLARARLNEGRCYPVNSADHTNSLTAALEQFSKLAELPGGEDLLWQSRLRRVVALRLLNRLPEAEASLKTLLSEEVPEMIRRDAQAERIRLVLALGETRKAQQLTIQLTGESNNPTAELDFACLESLMASLSVAQEAMNKSQAAALSKRATALVEAIEQRHGPYWMRRAETLLAKSMASTGPTFDEGADLATLSRVAESYYRGGQIEEALNTYQKAYKQAVQTKKPKQALSLAIRSGAIAQQSGRSEAAIEFFRKPALELKDQPRSGESHLQSAILAAQLARSSSPEGRRKALDRYTMLLKEHQEHWPDSATADQATFWLATLRESQKRWAEAAQLCESIRPAFREFDQAIIALSRCRNNQLEQLEAKSKPTRAAGLAAAQFFENQIDPTGKFDSPISWIDTKRLSALAAARIRLRYTDEDHELAERLLTSALKSVSNKKSSAPAASDLTEQWKAEAVLLRVFALAQLDRMDDASAAFRELQNPSPLGLFGLLEDCSRLLETKYSNPKGLGEAASAKGIEKANLVLEIAQRLQPYTVDAQSFTPNQLARFQRARAKALASADQTGEALAEYDQLIQKRPKDGTLREARAELLLATGAEESLRKALTAWRDLEQKSRPGGDRWFRARLAQAEALVQLGEKKKAAKRIRLTQALRPTLGGEDMKRRFLELLETTQD